MTSIEKIAARAATAKRASTFTESVIREMTRVANEYGAINLAQGFPDFPMPEPMKDAACAAIHGDINQYAITWGSPALRLAIAEKYRKWYGMDVDPEREITVCCGATEAMASTFLALIDPGDEVIVFEPYLRELRAGRDPRGGEAGVRAAGGAGLEVGSGQAAGRVLEQDAGDCRQHSAQSDRQSLYARRDLADRGAVSEVRRDRDNGRDLRAHPVRGRAPRAGDVARDARADRHHLRIVQDLQLHRWRLGYTVAPAEFTSPIRKVHDFLTVGAPAPLQAAGAIGMAFDTDYYNHLALEYRARRDIMCSALDEAGFKYAAPEGAYYILADFSEISDLESREFAIWLAKEVGVATVPGMSFYSRPELGRSVTRFAFCKKLETLERAAERLSSVRALA